MTSATYTLATLDPSSVDPYYSPPAPPPAVIPATVSFETGRGKKVAPPSEEAMTRALKILHAAERDVLEAGEMPSKRQRVGSPPTEMTFAPLPDLPVTPALSKHPAHSIDSTGPGGSLFQLGTGASAPPPSSEARAQVTALFDDSTARTTPVSGFQLGATHAEPSAAGSSSGRNLSSGFQLGSGQSAPQVNAENRARALAIFNDEPQALPTSSSHAPQSPLPSTLRPIRLSSIGGSLARPSTPTRTPLQTRTNTFSIGGPVTPQSTKLPKRINILTPGSTPRRIGLGSTPSRKARAGFSTPFKTGAAARPSSALKPSGLRAPVALESKPQPIWKPVFDLTPPPDRKDMRAAYLYPQFYSPSELAEIGLPNELWHLNYDNAIRYQFIGEDASILGNAQAFDRLKLEGCELVTQKWVDNHWSLILWKIAGQVLARPTLFGEKWNWYEVLCQLKYRYEREYGSAERPIIRRIQEHDSSPSLPMVLCVCGVHWPEPVLNEKKEPVPQRPYIDLTDGWYRIHAAVDDSMARAIVKGKIRVGRKLSLSGAKLDSGAEGADIFAAYDKSYLVLTGNSCHLARWDAKLGVQGSPFVAGLSSLTVDGGIVVLMDVVLERVYPLAFMKADRGSREPPWGEDEEARLADEWKTKYEAETTKLGEEMRKTLEKMEDLASLLASHAEDVGPISGSRPDSVDDDFEALLDTDSKDLMARLRAYSGAQIVHLAAHARQRLQQAADDERAGFEARLKELCPPREVRDFRMVRLRDGREGRKEAMRTGLLNVWDARALGNELVEGKRYLVSNIVPGRAGDWSKPTTSTSKEVYLHTRRDTRWQTVPQPERKL